MLLALTRNRGHRQYISGQFCPMACCTPCSEMMNASSDDLLLAMQHNWRSSAACCTERGKVNTCGPADLRKRRRISLSVNLQP